MCFLDLFHHYFLVIQILLNLRQHPMTRHLLTHHLIHCFQHQHLTIHHHRHHL
jgi:hypothetical protein